MQPQTQIFNNFTEEFTGALEAQARSDSDPRPFYLLSVGDHIHRVNARDSVPHVWAGRVQVVKNHITWIDAAESMTDGIQTRDITRNGKAHKQAGLPIWAGSIVNTVLRDHADVLVTTIESFEGVPEAEINPRLFNTIISGLESFPYVIEPDWRVRDARLNSLVPPVIGEWKKTPRKYLELAAEKGGLVIRRAMAVSGAKAIEASDTVAEGRANLYLQAIDEVLAAYDRFASHANLYLDEQERIIQSTKEGVKDTYDPYDRYLLWLLGRKGIETARGVTRDDMESLIGAVKQGGQPQSGLTRDDILALADALRNPAPVQEHPVALTDIPESPTQTSTAEYRRRTLAEKQADARERNGKN